MKNLMLKTSLCLTVLLGASGVAVAGGGGDYDYPCLDGTHARYGERCKNERYTTYSCSVKVEGDFVGQVRKVDLVLRENVVAKKIERYSFVEGNFPGAYQHSFYLPVQKIGSLTYRIHFPHPTYEPRTEFDLRLQLVPDEQSARISGTNNDIVIDQTVGCSVKVQ
ncbi:MAG: hypothetical protein V4760_08800 [Bdellovibrionota bacterium]